MEKLLMNYIDSYFEKKKHEMAKIFDINGDLTFTFDDKNNVNIFNANGKLLLRATYDIIGIYNTQNNVWYWGWILDFVDKDRTKKTKAIRKFSHHIEDIKFSKYADQSIIHYYTSNSHFITDIKYVIIFVKIMMYVVKTKWYFRIQHDDTKPIYEYITINKIIEIKS